MKNNFKQIMVNVDTKERMNDLISSFGMKVSYNELINFLINNWNDKKSIDAKKVDLD